MRRSVDVCSTSKVEGADLLKTLEYDGEWLATAVNGDLLDALKMFKGPIIEFHISNVHRREQIYHRSYVSMTATTVMAGLGAKGYPLAVNAMELLIERQMR
jgi:3-dehydroquinate dehydratase